MSSMDFNGLATVLGAYLWKPQLLLSASPMGSSTNRPPLLISDKQWNRRSPGPLGDGVRRLHFKLEEGEATVHPKAPRLEVS